MKENLYRGKLKKGIGAWVTGSLIIENSPLQCFQTEEPREDKYLIGKSGFADWSMPRPFTAAEVTKESVGQFVGLLSKNKTKVFEGDIVNVTNKGIYNGLRVVMWDKILLCYVLVWAHLYSEWKGSNCGITYLKVSGGIKVEIVGNIIDNPEMLK